MASPTEFTQDSIANEIVAYLIDSQPSNFTPKNFPRDQSLLDIQILDSFGVLNLIEFIEQKWTVEISDEEVTLENFLTVDSIIAFVREKVG